MTRSRGKPSKTLVETWFPHTVMLDAETVSKNTWQIALFYSQVGIGFRDQHARLRRLGDHDNYVYSFKDPQHASTFQALFGGQLKIASPKLPSDPYDFS
jgi:hypothetical protein